MIVWRPEMAIGNDAIDADHRFLLALINDVESAFGDSAPNAMLRQTLARLAEYTDFHFQREERMQRAVMYPAREDHAAKHSALAEQLVQIIREIETLATDPRRDRATIDRVATLSRDWLINHILGEDLLMRSYFRKRSPTFVA